MKRVLVLTGTPGVGKSSVARLLASRLAGVHINLSELVKSKGLDCGLDRKRETLIADTRNVSKQVGEIVAQSDGYIVVEGHFAVDVVKAEDAFLVLVLRRNPDELRKVLRKRGFKESKVLENVAAEILDICLSDAVETYGEERVCEVDVSGRTEEEVAEEIFCVVEGHKECRTGVVDWLAKLEMEGRLDEFLASF
ncbi:MAG: adenylate kinase family protein [Candidatus Bathyarchaeota archaeon]|nr:adenylate kinase family protein [Candidatus Bathyarchaeota archaeon]